MMLRRKKALCAVLTGIIAGMPLLAAAEVSIAPAFLRRVDLLFAHGLHHGVADVIHALEAERVERKVGDLVVFIHDEHDLVVILRP